MKKYYLVKASRKDARNVERVLFNCLIDRARICSLIKSIELTGDSTNAYFVVGGQQYSCHKVLAATKAILLSVGISSKIYDYDTLRSIQLDELIWGTLSNSAGRTLQNYQNNPTMTSHMRTLTNAFMVKAGLFSNHLFCTECDGFADPVELSSIKGDYKCSFCNTESTIDGPLITGKVPITHLSDKEQLYLLGLPIEVQVEIINEEVCQENYKGEQMFMGCDVSVGTITPHRRRRRSRAITMMLDVSLISADEIEQLSWNSSFSCD